MTSTPHTYHGQRFFAIQHEIETGNATSATLDAYLLVGEAYFRDLAAATTGTTQKAHLWKADVFHAARHGDIFTKAQFCLEQATYYLRLAQTQQTMQQEKTATRWTSRFHKQAAQWARLAYVCLDTTQE